VETAREIPNVGKSFSLEHARGEARAIAGGAINQHWPLAFQLVRALL
jgi:hypothetical protein